MDILFALERFYILFRVITLGSFIVGILGLILFLLNRSESKRLKRKNLGLVLFVQMWLFGLIFLLLNNLFKNNAKKELLHKLSQTDLIFEKCNEQLDRNESEQLRRLLTEIKNISRHHSSPTYCGNIKFKYLNEIVNLRIERDNTIRTEYWIYWDKYIVTKDNPIGYLRTDKLNKMNCP
jgi:hypothetical protein